MRIFPINLQSASASKFSLKAQIPQNLEEPQFEQFRLNKQIGRTWSYEPEAQPIPVCEEKKVVLVDLAQIECRAQLISKSNWKNFIDWMGFQCAKDSQAQGVIYYKAQTVARMAGSVLFTRIGNRIFYLPAEEGLNNWEKIQLDDLLKKVRQSLDNHSKIKKYSLTKKDIFLSELQAADEIWALQVRKGIISITEILNTMFKKESSGEMTSFLAGELNN